MKLGQKISLLRQQNNMSQENLAVAMGVTRQAVSKWELDEVTPKTATLIKLAKLFNIEVQLLIDDDSEIGLEIQKSPIDKCVDNTSKTDGQLTEVKQHRDKSTVKKTPFHFKLIICAAIAIILIVIYILMSTVFKMSVSAYYLYRMGAYIVLFILLVILIIEIIKYYRNKNK